MNIRLSKAPWTLVLGTMLIINIGVAHAETLVVTAMEDSGNFDQRTVEDTVSDASAVLPAEQETQKPTNDDATELKKDPREVTPDQDRQTRYGVGYEYRMQRQGQIQRPERIERPQRPQRPERLERPGRHGH